MSESTPLELLEGIVIKLTPNLSRFDRGGILSVTVGTNINSERTEDTTELLRALADEIDKIEAEAPRHWLIDHVTVNGYSGYACAYLRRNV